MDIINYFDRTNIVNLLFRKDRRIETKEEFDRFNFPLNTDKVYFIEASCPDSADGFPTAGTKGCFLSHLGILEKARNDKLNNILILEDDITFSKGIVEVGEKAINQLSEIDWDIAYFSHSFDEDNTDLKWISLDKPLMCTHFYAVNGKCLDDLIDFLHKVLQRPPGHPDGGPMHYDGAINTFRRQNPDKKVIYFSKNLGFQRPSKTDIHETSFIDKNPITKHIVPYLRKIKGYLLKLTR